MSGPLINLTEEQEEFALNHGIVNNLKYIEKGSLYRLIFTGSMAGSGYDILGECVIIDYKGNGTDISTVEFKPVDIYRQGLVQDSDIYSNWPVSNLEYISIFKIGNRDDYPEYYL